jgi:formylglycine-generating enzyme required for sulfatase activity
LRSSLDPTVRSYLIDRLGAVVEARPLAGALERQREDSLRRALVLALGEIGPDRLPPAEREPLIPRFVELYREDPDPGLHGATGWLLRQWGQQAKLQEVEQRLRTGKPEGQRRWYVNGQGQIMVILPRPGEFWMGEGQERQRRRINRSFALATREVTVAEFLRFREKHQSWEQGTPTEDCPVNLVSWYDAVAYCNWLSEQEGIPKEQWCYVPSEKNEYGPGMKMAPDYLQRTGYRLPTESEWEHACRAGCATGWSHGDAEELLSRYAWFAGNVAGNALGRLRPVGSLRPNDWGFFDLHGNVWEWCQGRWKNVAAGEEIEDKEDIEDIKNIKGNQTFNSPEDRLLRGGCISYDGVDLRCAYRSRGPAGIRNITVGFRPARTCR